METIINANRLLASFSHGTLSLLKPHLREIGLPQGLELQRSHDPIEKVYFIASGVASMIAFAGEGRAVETGMVGREGAINAFEALHELPAFGLTTVQVAGHGAVIGAAQFRAAVRKDADAVEAVARFHAALAVQARQSAACNASHLLEARLARWLLQTRERTGDDTLPLTQEFIAIMLGVQRTSVTLTIGNLTKRNLIENNRGTITITDVPGLEAIACECHDLINKYYRQVNV